MNQPPDDPLSTAARQALDDDLASLPASTSSALAQARQQALTRHQASTLAFRGLWGAALASTAALAISLYLILQAPAEPDPEIADADILSSEDNLELYQQLDFYHWLESEGFSSEEV